LGEDVAGNRCPELALSAFERAVLPPLSLILNHFADLVTKTEQTRYPCLTNSLQEYKGADGKAAPY
jgi:hypothetical protein